MKRILIVALVACLYVANVFSKPLTTYTEVVNGPVKQMTVKSMQMMSQRVWVYWYDTTGRLEEFAYYMNGQLNSGFVRQYTDSAYTDFKYNESGLIEGRFDCITLDSLGRPVCKWCYESGVPHMVDSIVYGDQQKEIEHYSMRDSALVLCYTCEYDSIGRLSRKHNNFWGNNTIWAYEYLSDGNYLETETDKDGRLVKELNIFDQEGRLIEIKGDEVDSKFSKFDKYGNWTIWVEKRNIPIAKYTYTYERTFEYYE